jgi:hypothetical protein
MKLKFMMLTYETEGDFAARTDDGQKGGEHIFNP